MSEFKFAETPKSSDQGQVKTQKWGMNVVILGMFVVLMVSILVMGVIFIRLYSETVKAFKIQLEDVKTAYLKKNEKLQQDLEHFAKLMEQSQKEKQSLKAELSKAIASGDEEKSKMYEKLSAQYDTVLAQMKIEKQKQEEAFNTRLASYEQKIQTLMNEGKSKEEAMEEALKDYMVPSPSPTNPPAGEIPSTLGNPADPLALENPEGEGGGVSGEVKEVNPLEKTLSDLIKVGVLVALTKAFGPGALAIAGLFDSMSEKDREVLKEFSERVLKDGEIQEEAAEDYMDKLGYTGLEDPISFYQGMKKIMEEAQSQNKMAPEKTGRLIQEYDHFLQELQRDPALLEISKSIGIRRVLELDKGLETWRANPKDVNQFGRSLQILWEQWKVQQLPPEHAKKAVLYYLKHYMKLEESEPLEKVVETLFQEK